LYDKLPDVSDTTILVSEELANPFNWALDPVNVVAVILPK
jgi:hypothetical protein